MDITSLYNVNSNMIRTAARIQEAEAAAAAGTTINSNNSFSNILNSAIDNINLTNSYLSDMENEELKFALGETDNTHDLLIAMNKASTALQYTVAVRDKFMESYKELMNMQI
ncbi:MAG: flagellar hook-basal body complex protein FliE [Lachnospiraceae bacterium]|nr:flagellar hook-basal body complex protein FliE [Lachnospiraceae bacterium]MDD7049678.1 flagellar hook-basal body complex protein FliE [Lachnospiraceae bacterium]MDY3221740.1 flagellar hook-basal body complex protein FliE [Lachnospiraceae bacterium]